MANIVFYEKAGCAGNAKQRALLERAGHTLVRRDLLTASWTRENLLPYLDPLPVGDWFNRAAPRVKAGQVVPEQLTREAALALLVEEPLLIRRPLMQREDGARLVGFELAEVERFVGLGAARPSGSSSLEGCAALAGAAEAGLVSRDDVSTKG